MENNFLHIAMYGTMYGFTLTIEIIVRYYGRLSLLLIIQSNNLYICLNYIMEYGCKKVICMFSHLYIHILTRFDEFRRLCSRLASNG